jgi:hypothetical protein
VHRVAGLRSGKSGDAVEKVLRTTGFFSLIWIGSGEITFLIGFSLVFLTLIPFRHCKNDVSAI